MKIQYTYDQQTDSHGYEIIDVDFYNREYVWNEDDGFSSLKDARVAAQKYVNNYEPEDYWWERNEGMSHQEQMANYKRLK